MAATPARPLILLPALAVAAAGLASLGLALAPRAPLDLAPPPAAAPQTLPAAVPPAPWPPLFGVPPPPATQVPVSPTAAPQAPPAPRPNLTLRGVAVDDAGGWALIEGDQSILLARRGTPVGEGHAVAQVLADGVQIDGPDGPWRLDFAARAPSEGRPRRSLPSTILGGVRVFIDESGMPMPIPPDPRSQAPDRSGGDNR